MVSPGRVAFTIFGLDIMWYGILIGIGFLISTLIAIRKSPAHNLDKDLFLDLIIGVIPAAIIGARAYYVIFSWESYVGNGKAAEVPDAIKKAIEEAKKNLIEVPVVGTTIPHEFIGKFGSAKVMLKPAAEGTGIIAGGSVRPVIELAGYRDIRTKVIGTNNPRNVVYATLEGLKSMQTLEHVAKKRGLKAEDIL